MAALITDYFNCLQLEFSKTVFEPETGYVSTSIYILFALDRPIKYRHVSSDYTVGIMLYRTASHQTGQIYVTLLD